MAPGQEPHPSWKRVSESKWEQAYGFQDAFYGRIVGKAGESALFLVASSMSIRFAGNISEEEQAMRLRNAWIQMRFLYPIIAAVAHGKKRVYQSPVEMAEVHDWAARTFRVMGNATITDIWHNLVKTEQPTMHFIPKTHELFLQAEHTHFDGRGGLHFWDEFFTLLVNPKPVTIGQDLGNLPGRSDDYVNTKERRPGRGVDLATHMLQALEVSPPETPISYHLTKTNKVPGHPLPPINSRATFKFSPRDTSRINDACKDRNLSLVAVWHTAVVLASQDVQREANAEPGSAYSTCANFDLRRYFKDNHRRDSDKRAYIGNFHCVLPYKVKPNGRTFLEVAQDLTSFYRLGLQDQPDIWAALRPMMEGIGESFSDGPPADTTPAVSSLGVLDHFVKRNYSGPACECYIGDAWFGVTATGSWMESFIWLFQGSLVLNSCFNRIYYLDEEVDAFHSRVRSHMIQGLGLSNVLGDSRL
ncbi:hypothetical protein S7711_05816 [Stachybotrys chartarum IBT 7711]|uniref:Uncharacterized protein n=1 Tax=Stachybotrys chartarum (strain CBS 109288 / IBT 7711) TaxID=1280523 RepID=A0A084AM54_STACB|nr:hypothetical protein S7711_05816 [Stachybotrys chartarum IBT 7711]KFA56160.1 hypothetical protein S40293_00035 [Stachybotrys chartarum IBT 40293]